MRTRGFSLVEFMIAVTIGLFLVAGLVYLIAETSRSRAEMERSSRQIENGRYAIDRIAEDLRHAGFFGEVTLSDLPKPAAVPDPCITALVTGNDGLAFPVQAYDGGASLPSPLNVSTCLGSLNWKPQTDILVVRRASTNTFTVAEAASTSATSTSSADPNRPNKLFIQTGFVCAPPCPSPPQIAFAHKIDRGQNSGTFDLRRITGGTDPYFTSDIARVRQYMVRIYFVSTVNESGEAIPTLKVFELGGGGSGPQFNLATIAEGIEELRFDFGIDTNTTNDGVADNCGATGLVRFTACDGSVLATNVLQVNHWSHVVAVQIYIVARNTETSPGYTDDKTYNLGLKGYSNGGAPYGDQYRRHSYSTYVRLNNVSMPRERN